MLHSRLRILLTALLVCGGLTALVLSPPFQTPDGGSHFFRAFELAEGRVIAEKRGAVSGGEIPVAAEAEFLRYVVRILHPPQQLTAAELFHLLDESPRLTTGELAKLKFVPCPYILYSPAPYLPQTLAVFLAMRMHLRDISAFYLAGLFSLFACALCWFWSFRALDFSPRGTWLVFVVAGLPTTLYFSASVNADALTVNLCILNVALASRLHHSFTQPAFRRFLAVTVLVSLCKTIYFIVPLAVLPLALSQTPLCSREGRARGLQALAAAVVPSLVWSALSRHTFFVWNTGAGVDPAAQLQFMTAHPLLVLEKFAVQLFKQRVGTANMLVGLLGWLDAPVATGYRALSWALLLLTPLFGDASERRPGPLVYSWMAAMTLAFLLALCVSQYLTWNAVGGELTLLQGRYFLPFLPVALLFLPQVFRLRQTGQAILIGLLLAAFCATWWGMVRALLARYWIA